VPITPPPMIMTSECINQIPSGLTGWINPLFFEKDMFKKWGNIYQKGSDPHLYQYHYFAELHYMPQCLNICQTTTQIAKTSSVISG
jgi:hypothetical protein